MRKLAVVALYWGTGASANLPADDGPAPVAFPGGQLWGGKDMRRLVVAVVGLWLGLGLNISPALGNLIDSGDFEGNNAPWTFAGGG